ncbi:hypothetical protein [Bacillus pinisoli]|uniref:hypothetical protein n=1 Tax=Bacillus pinisoli TaxID=2901866 RepID=UPI001FF61A32|nr:hypothetical protein [Bacillus pinisoli]
MTLSIYTILFWLLLSLLLLEKKHLHNKLLAFTFMTAVFLNTHVFLVIADPLKLLKVTQEPVDYISFVMYRSFITPLLITYVVNMIFNKKRRLVVPLLFSILFFWLLDLFNMKQEIITYEKWTSFYTISYLTTLLLLCCLSVKLFKKKGWVS